MSTNFTLDTRGRMLANPINATPEMFNVAESSSLPKRRRQFGEEPHKNATAGFSRLSHPPGRRESDRLQRRTEFSREPGFVR